MIAGVGGARLDRPSMTAAGAPLKARGCPPIFCENRFPPRPLRGAPLCSAALTAAPSPVFVHVFSMMRTQAMETIMSMFQPISVASDRVMAALVAGLEIEFGEGGGETLARRFLEAEESDFLWDARLAAAGGRVWAGIHRRRSSPTAFRPARLAIWRQKRRISANF